MEIDYKKEYEAMVQRARELHETGNELTKRQMEIVCHELRESEDERMRKAALEGIEYLERDCGWDVIGDIDILDVKDYLEKQKEQKPPIAGNDFGWIDELKHDLEHPEELDQKVDDVLKQRKGIRALEWSKEDEHRRNDAIYFLESAMRHYADTSEIEKTIAWLKSPHPQPKAELTLLDENIIEAAVAFVEQNDHFNVWRGIDKHTVLKALRSLKPHWKPSEEQMEALHTVCYVPELEVYGGLTYWLKELYEQLKKL